MPPVSWPLVHPDFWETADELPDFSDESTFRYGVPPQKPGAARAPGSTKECSTQTEPWEAAPAPERVETVRLRTVYAGRPRPATEIRLARVT
eukprot:3543009-Prymnesium_polylepis.1